VGEVVIEGDTGVDVPVPVSVTIVIGFCGSLLVTEMLPDALPAIAGENETFMVTLPPGVSVLGVDMPETPKEPPLTEINEISKFVPPGLVNVNVPMAVVPIVALPKFKLVELTLICGGAIAVPASATCPEETPVSVWTVKEPVTFPAEVASNQT
jgi:hypothetical protein